MATQKQIDADRLNALKHDIFAEASIVMGVTESGEGVGVFAHPEPISQPESAERVTSEIGFVPPFLTKPPNPPSNSAVTARHKADGCIVMSIG
jgi:hypothetical protein